MGLIGQAARGMGGVMNVGAGVARAGNAVLGGPVGSRSAAGALGALSSLHAHPYLTTGAVLGAASLFRYNTSAVQAVPRGPAISEVAPGRSSQHSNFDLGASGDLVFALHRLS